MMVECPACQHSYEIDQETDPINVTCPQCGAGFASESEAICNTIEQNHLWHFTDKGFTSPPLLHPCTEAAEPPTDLTTAEALEQSEHMAPPTRTNSVIWPWLFTILLLLMVSGLWVQKDAWLDNRWLRSHLIHMHLPLENRAKDWFIIPDSVDAKWITRSDNSRIMLISGSIRNLLSTTMPSPQIEIVFYSDRDPNLQVARRQLPITAKPDPATLAEAPYKMPERIDYIEGSSGQPFTLIVEALPEGIGDFTLSATTGEQQLPLKSQNKTM